MNKTYIPEAIVSVISLGFAAWLFPTVVVLQQGARLVSPDDLDLLVASAVAVLIVGLYLIIGAYFLMITIEHYVGLLYERYKKRVEKDL